MPKAVRILAEGRTVRDDRATVSRFSRRTARQDARGVSGSRSTDTAPSTPPCPVDMVNRLSSPNGIPMVRLGRRLIKAACPLPPQLRPFTGRRVVPKPVIGIARVFPNSGNAIHLKQRGYGDQASALVRRTQSKTPMHIDLKSERRNCVSHK